MKFEWQGKDYYIDGLLATQLLSLVYNIKKDWDFVILISGDRTVRVGKSVLGMTICAYLAYAMNKYKLKSQYVMDDIYFDNQRMMDKVQTKPQYSINHYDEGREGLAASKSMKVFQQDLLDFFAECGQLNHIFVIVLPDFFELKEEIAVGRSEFLINVYRKEQGKQVDMFKDGNKLPIVELKRGFFEFFNRSRKRDLYDKAKTTKRKNYGIIKANFIGRFIDQYPLGEEEYRKKKKEALSRFKEKKEAEKNTKPEKYTRPRNEYIYKRKEKDNIPVLQIIKEVEELYAVELSDKSIYKISNQIKSEKNQ